MSFFFSAQQSVFFPPLEGVRGKSRNILAIPRFSNFAVQLTAERGLTFTGIQLLSKNFMTFLQNLKLVVYLRSLLKKGILNKKGD